MANPQLVTYIKSQLAAGVVEPEIQKALIASGWSVADASAAFVEAKAPVAHAPASAPAPKPVVPAQPMQAQQPVQTFRASPLEPSSSPMTQTTMQMNVRGETHRGRGMLLSILIPIVLLAGAAAGAYFFVPQVREVIGFYLGGAEPVVEEVEIATTTPVQTYTDAHHGFAFDYPGGWFVSTEHSTTSTSSPLAVVEAVSHDPSLPHTFPEPTNYTFRAEVYPLDTFRFDVDDSAWITYATSTKQWLLGSCEDYTTGCKAKVSVATSSNVSVGTVPGYQMLGYNTGIILVALNNYGLVLNALTSTGPSADAHLDPTLQAVLDSFRVQ